MTFARVFLSSGGARRTAREAAACGGDRSSQHLELGRGLPPLDDRRERQCQRPRAEVSASIHEHGTIGQKKTDTRGLDCSPRQLGAMFFLTSSVSQPWKHRQPGKTLADCSHKETLEQNDAVGTDMIELDALQVRRRAGGGVRALLVLPHRAAAGRTSRAAPTRPGQNRQGEFGAPTQSFVSAALSAWLRFVSDFLFGATTPLYISKSDSKI